MRVPRVPVSVVVLVMGALLMACCIGWAVLVEEVVPSICQDPTVAANHIGPIRCEE